MVRVSPIISGSAAYASQCIQCRDCVEKCPQSLPIPDLLEQVAKEFEGDSLKDIEAAARRMFHA